MLNVNCVAEDNPRRSQSKVRLHFLETCRNFKYPRRTRIADKLLQSEVLASKNVLFEEIGWYASFPDASTYLHLKTQKTFCDFPFC